jgi:O-antigen/teichoic acid export membrane protein
VVLLTAAGITSNVERKSRSIFRESSSVFAAQVLMLLSGVLNNFFVARLGGPDGKGFIYTLQLFAAAGLIFTNFGIGPAAVYHFRRDNGFTVEEVAAGLLWPSFLLGCLPLGLLAVLRYSPIALFHTGIWASAAMLAFAVIPANTLAWNLGYLYLAKGEIAGYNFLRVSQSAFFTVLLVGLFVAHVTELRILVTAWMTGVCVPALLAVIVLSRTFGIWRMPSRRFVRHAFEFGWRSHLGAVVQYMQHRADVVLVMYFLPLRELGIYSLAVGLVELLWYVPQSVSQVLLPHIASSNESDADSITSAFCRASISAAALLSLLLAVASTFVIPWLLPAFREAIPAIWIMLPGAVGASVFKVLSADLNGRGQPLRTLFPASVGLAFSVAGSCYAIPRFGMRGAAAVTSLSYLLNASLYIRIFARTSSLTPRSLIIMRSADLAWYRRLLLAGRRS